MLALPIMIAAVPPLAYSVSLAMVPTGILLWGAAVGPQDSTVKALVADLVPAHRRATAYGLFAAGQGAGAFAGGALYQYSRTALFIAVAVSEAVALLTLITHVATRHLPSHN